MPDLLLGVSGGLVPTVFVVLVSHSPVPVGWTASEIGQGRKKPLGKYWDP